MIPLLWLRCECVVCVVIADQNMVTKRDPTWVYKAILKHYIFVAKKHDICWDRPQSTVLQESEPLKDSQTGPEHPSPTLPHPWNICVAFCQLKVVYSSFSRTCESPSQCWGWYLCVVWMRLLRHVGGAGCTLGSRIKWPHGFLDRLLINQLDIYFSTTL